METSCLKKKLTVLVTCIGGHFIGDICTALRDSPDMNLTIIGVDNNEASPGRVLCDHFFPIASAETNPKNFVDDLINIHRKIKFDFILALSEAETLALSKRQDIFQTLNIKTSTSSHETVGKIVDKNLLYDELIRANLQNCRYQKIDNLDDFDEATEYCGYPNSKVVIKPRVGRGSRGVLIMDPETKDFQSLLPDRLCGVGPKSEIKKILNSKKHGFTRLICMPFLEGPVFDVDCIVKDGELLNCVSRVRQLKNPLSPYSTGHKVELNSTVIDYAKKICRTLCMDGAADFYIIIEQTLGIPILLDAGARFSGSVGGTYVAGSNFLTQLIRSKMGWPLEDMQIRNNCVLRPFITMRAIPAANEGDLL